MKGVNTSGDRIGRYRLLQILGEGGMGVVHLAADDDGRKVAIKILRPQVAADQTAVRRLAREVDTMRRVRSPYVAEILDADVTAVQPYIVTRFVPGRTLEEAVAEGGPLSGRLLQRLATGLAQALAAIHGAGVIHRDLKPGNVMLPFTGEGGASSSHGMHGGDPVLIDFGIAQAMDATRLTATGMVIGTPGYIAPEIIEGEEAGSPADIHAWAGTLIYAATGRPPFGSGTFESIFYKIMHSTPDLDGVPEAILPLIRAALARHPAERPTAVTLVQLARRIDLDATMTDRTRVDAPRQAFGLPAPATRVNPPPPSRQFTAPPVAAETAAGSAAGSAAGGAAAASPTPAQSPSQGELQQPKDFKGMLPPVPPPPPPPRSEPRARRQSAARPYQQPPQQQRPYQPPLQAQGYQPYTQPRQPQIQQPDPRQGAGMAGADATRHDRPSPEQQRRKPYGWYRLCSLAALAAVLGLAETKPVLTLLGVLAGAVVLRAADRAAQSMESKRVRRGPGSGDVVGAAFKTPFALPGALLKTAMWGGVQLFAGLVLVLVLMITNPSMTIAQAVSLGSIAVIAVHFLGPGSVGPRRQMARVWGAVLPRPEPAIILTLCLGVLAAVLFGTSVGAAPDLRPISFGSETQTLNDLKNGIRSTIGLG